MGRRPAPWTSVRRGPTRARPGSYETTRNTATATGKWSAAHRAPPLVISPGPNRSSMSSFPRSIYLSFTLPVPERTPDLIATSLHGSPGTWGVPAAARLVGTTPAAAEYTIDEQDHRGVDPRGHHSVRRPERNHHTEYGWRPRSPSNRATPPPAIQQQSGSRSLTIRKIVQPPVQRPEVRFHGDRSHA